MDNNCMQNKRTIAILLTRHHSIFSNFIYVISGRGYTHASLSLDSDRDCFYSFTFKGFSIEHPKKRRSTNKKRKSVCYQLTVSESSYERLKTQITGILEKQDEYQYSSFGLFLCILHIPHKFRKEYFCSQFVAEMLTQSSAIELKRHSSLYLPNQFVKELECHPHLSGTLYNTV